MKPCGSQRGWLDFSRSVRRARSSGLLAGSDISASDSPSVPSTYSRSRPLAGSASPSDAARRSFVEVRPLPRRSRCDRRENSGADKAASWRGGPWGGSRQACDHGRKARARGPSDRWISSSDSNTRDDAIGHARRARQHQVLRADRFLSIAQQHQETSPPPPAPRLRRVHLCALQADPRVSARRPARVVPRCISHAASTSTFRSGARPRDA